MKLPKELQDLLNLLLRDWENQRQEQEKKEEQEEKEGQAFDLVKEIGDDVKKYLLDQIDKAPAETGRPLAPNPVKQASKHQDFDKFVNALEAAVQAANNGNLFSFTLLERLDQIFPGGNLNHALFLVDLMLLTPE